MIIFHFFLIHFFIFFIFFVSLKDKEKGGMLCHIKEKDEREKKEREERNRTPSMNLSFF